MKLSIKLIVTICMACFMFGQANGSDFYTKHAEGWFWYQDPPLIDEEEKKEVKKEASNANTPDSPSQKAHKKMEAFKKKLEDLKVIAMVDPTPHNVETYMRVQKEMVDRSESFSKTWQQVVLQRADLNPEVNNPTAQYAQSAKNEILDKNKQKIIASLSKTYGLIYFFRGNCPYCTGFAPIVKMFADKYNWNVMVISLDGSSSDVFPDIRPDNGISEALQIRNVPALIAYNSETNNVIPISYAMTSLDQLENNVMALTGENQ